MVDMERESVYINPIRNCWDEDKKEYVDIVPACSELAQISMIAESDDLNRPARFRRGDYLMFNLDDDTLETGYGLYIFEKAGRKQKSVCAASEIARFMTYGPKQGWTVTKVGALVGVYGSLVPGDTRYHREEKTNEHISEVATA